MADGTAITHAGGIVWRRSDRGLEFLLVRPKADPGGARDEWVLPKGHVEPGETPELTAVREVLEEAGAIVDLGDEAGRVAFEAGGEPVRCVLYAMELRARRASSEERPVLWATLDEVRRRMPFPDTVALVERVARSLGSGE